MRAAPIAITLLTVALAGCQAAQPEPPASTQAQPTTSTTAAPAPVPAPSTSKPAPRPSSPAPVTTPATSRPAATANRPAPKPSLSTDDRYIERLGANRIFPEHVLKDPNKRAAIISGGKAVCQVLAKGMSRKALIDTSVERTRIPREQAVAYIDAATSTYCPGR